MISARFTYDGGHFCHRYIGTLGLAAAASMEGGLSMHRLTVKQTKRELELAVKLAESVAPYVEGDILQREEWRAGMAKEARELAEVSFGENLLYVVAELYAARAAEFLGFSDTFLGVGGHVASLNSKKLSVQNHAAAAGAGFRAAGAAIRTFKTAQEISSQAKEEEAAGGGAAAGADPLSSLTPNQLKATQENLPIFLEAMWHVSVVDIERTLTSVTHKLCRDHSVSEEARRLRAEAVAQMGALFMEEALAKGGSKDPKAKVASMVQMLTPAGGAAKPGAAAAAAAAAAGAAAGAAAPSSGPAPTPASARGFSVEELREKRPGELKALLRERGVTEPDVVEKEDLVQLLVEVQGRV